MRSSRPCVSSRRIDLTRLWPSTCSAREKKLCVGSASSPRGAPLARRGIRVRPGHTRRVVNAYVAYYKAARPSQAIHAIPAPHPELMQPPLADDNLVCRCWAACTTTTASQGSVACVAGVFAAYPWGCSRPNGTSCESRSSRRRAVSDHEMRPSGVTNFHDAGSDRPHVRRVFADYGCQAMLVSVRTLPRQDLYGRRMKAYHDTESSQVDLARNTSSGLMCGPRKVPEVAA